MNWFEALILGIIQGLSEFLPISSSGHLELGKIVMGVEAESSLIFTVVVHGATYIGAHRLGAPYMGRSFGCPAVPQEVSNHVIDLIMDGSCMFIYHPNKNYFQQSTILNG